MGKAHDIAYGNSSGSTVYSVIVVPIDSSDPGGQVRLAPGETLRFGRAGSRRPSRSSSPGSSCPPPVTC
ncbi:hypothetical protein ACFXOY_00930 [Streptomyces niveus]|uniref:hypothetical protein n=1 Tax=Streptomyces niveus TaxID=193462 RepID=UPI0036891B0C